MKIKHIYHSGFEIKYDDCSIIIDVFNHLSQFKDKKIYCFCTHAHGDHYHPDIEKLQNHNDVTYILSDDIPSSLENAHVVKQGDHLVLDDLIIDVYGTTDQGVSFLIQRKDQVFFHSGDLNWWHWPENTLEKQEAEKEEYQSEIEPLIGKHVDFAFVPVDDRLGIGSRLAMDYFIEQINPKYLIPMHFSDRFETVSTLATDSDTKLLIPKATNCYIY